MRNNICFVYLLLLIVLPVCSKNVSHFSIYEIMCEQQVEPLGIENKSPRFSWKVVSQQRAYRQSAYRILVTDIEGALAADEGTIWDSGKCFSSNSVLIPFQGRELHSATRYYWKVKVWNEAGEESVWSKQGSFVTGMMKERDWGKAQWIALEKDDPEKNLYPGIHAPLVGKMIGGRKVGGYKLPMFRKELLINKEVKEAIVNISGLGHFDFYVNGEKVGNHFLDPGWTNYAKTALYLTFDVTPLLKKENVLGVILGNGFYNVPRERYFKQLISFGAPKVKLVLSLKYTDGSSELVVTNRNWKVCESPITYSSIYGGEDYDARKYQSSWMNPGFNDDLWTAPVITKTEMELKVQTSAPLTVRDQLPVVRKYQNSKGNWIFDFGQNFSGIVRLKVRGYGGHKVTMKPGELLEKDSTVNQRASGGPYFWSYTLSGKGVEEWHIIAVCLQGIRIAIPAAALLAIPSSAVAAALNSMPAWLTDGMSIGGGMVVAVGYAMVINMMATKEVWPFFAIGFCLAAVSDLTLIALGVIAVSMALIYLKLSENAGSGNGGSNTGDPLGDILNDY